MYLTLAEASVLATHVFGLVGRPKTNKIYALTWVNPIPANSARIRAVRQIEGDHDFILLGLASDNVGEGGNLIDIRVGGSPLFNRDAFTGQTLGRSGAAIDRKPVVLPFPHRIFAGATVEGFFTEVGGVAVNRANVLLHGFAVYG